MRTSLWKCVLGLGRSLSTLLLAAVFSAGVARADEPFARSRDYDLQHSKIVLKFDVDQKRVIGDVTHTLSILKDTNQIWFDSVGLTIQSVLLNKSSAKFESKDDKLMITRHDDLIQVGGKFPRLTKKEPRARLNEIKRLLQMLR